MEIRTIGDGDIARCAEIYNYYIENTTVTFEETPLSAEEFGGRVAHIKKDYPYFVAELDGVVVGYAYLDKYNERSAYRYTADLSVYLDKDCVAKGMGSLLYESIERAACDMGIRNIVSLVTEENEPSKAFHARHGFDTVGTLSKVGIKFGRWLDVVLFQKKIL